MDDNRLWAVFWGVFVTIVVTLTVCMTFYFSTTTLRAMERGYTTCAVPGVSGWQWCAPHGRKD